MVAPSTVPPDETTTVPPVSISRPFWVTVEPPLVWPSNLKFFGYGTVPNGTARRAFFEDGDDVFIFSEGESVLGRYRILKINNTNLEFEELATGRRGTTPLMEDQAGQGPA